MAHKGKFKPKNPQKYKGDVTNIVYRSFWELKFMRYLDSHPDILEWASEEIVIPYISPVDRKVHRYFPDFWVKMMSTDKQINTMLIEIKPSKQTKQPVQKDRVTRRYINELKTYGVNTAKWQAAKKFCDDNNWYFKVLTENELGIGKN